MVSLLLVPRRIRIALIVSFLTKLHRECHVTDYGVQFFPEIGLAHSHLLAVSADLNSFRIHLERLLSRLDQFNSNMSGVQIMKGSGFCVTFLNTT